MSLPLGIIISVVAGYLLGNISLGIIVSRAFGVNDIRRVGSGNAGSTNVLRTLGWVPSVLTLVGDCLKAYIAARIGAYLAGDAGMLAGGLSAIVGHDFPVFLSFRGGKGVASTLGLMLAVDWRVGLILLAWVVLIAFFTHYVSVGSITGAIVMPILTGVMNKGRENLAIIVIFVAAAAALAIFCHRANIGRLIRGEENRLDFKKISKISSKLKIWKK